MVVSSTQIGILRLAVRIKQKTKIHHMKNLLTSFFILCTLSVFAQKQFAVVCNQNESKFEVIVMGEEKPFHKVIKDGFPNQRVAETYLNENAGSIVCGNRDPNLPPPTTAGRQKTTSRSTNAPGQRGNIRPARVKAYDKNFRIIGSVSQMFSLGKLYPGNDISASQGLGYSIGADIAFGKAMQIGAGFHYTSLMGAFEEMQLDVDFNGTDYLGSINALKGELLMKSTALMKKDSWFLFEFGFAYYFDVKSSTDIALEELLPELNDHFFGLRWGIGKDTRGFNFILSGEFIYGLTDSDIVEKETFFNLKLGAGYAF